jgi:uncharacterized membrane protein
MVLILIVSIAVITFIRALDKTTIAGLKDIPGPPSLVEGLE